MLEAIKRRSSYESLDCDPEQFRADHMFAAGHRRKLTRAAVTLVAAWASDANLAFTGDKSFMISESGDAFVMYGVQNRTWVVMGDSVNLSAARSELTWAIRRACHAAGGRFAYAKRAKHCRQFSSTWACSRRSMVRKRAFRCPASRL